MENDISLPCMPSVCYGSDNETNSDSACPHTYADTTSVGFLQHDLNAGYLTKHNVQWQDLVSTFSFTDVVFLMEMFLETMYFYSKPQMMNSTTVTGTELCYERILQSILAKRKQG